MNDRQKMKMLKTYIEKRKDDYDLINAQDVYAALASIESGVTTVATVHGYFSFEYISKGAIIEGSKEDKEILKDEQDAYSNSAKVIAVDKRIREYIKKQSGVDAHTIKNFINVDEFKVNKNNASAIKKRV